MKFPLRDFKDSDDQYLLFDHQGCWLPSVKYKKYRYVDLISSEKKKRWSSKQHEVWYFQCVNAFMKDSAVSTMMTSSDRNIFRVTGHLCGEFKGQ